MEQIFISYKIAPFLYEINKIKVGRVIEHTKYLLFSIKKVGFVH